MVPATAAGQYEQHSGSIKQGCWSASVLHQTAATHPENGAPDPAVFEGLWDLGGYPVRGPLHSIAPAC
jgi:hypothetical protein